MIRVTTLFASRAGASARYYGGYLTKNGCELLGRWTGTQAPELGLTGEVTPDRLESVLLGRHPSSGESLGRELLDRIDKNGNVTKAVAGYDATFSAPKSVSVLWGLTGDEPSRRPTAAHPRRHLLEGPDRRRPVVRTRWSGAEATPAGVRLLFPIGAARRAERRYGVAFDDIVNGQAEIAGVPVELLHQFAKRAHDVAIEMDHRVADLIERTGREPSDREYSAMEREASGDTRADKTGLGADQLRARWTREAATLGIDATSLVTDVSAAAHRQPIGPSTLGVDEVLETLAARQSTWNRLDVLRVISGAVSPQPGHDATTWTAALERAVDTVLDACIDLDPQATPDLDGAATADPSTSNQSPRRRRAR